MILTADHFSMHDVYNPKRQVVADRPSRREKMTFDAFSKRLKSIIDFFAKPRASQEFRPVPPSVSPLKGQKVSVAEMNNIMHQIRTPTHIEIVAHTTTDHRRKDAEGNPNPHKNITKLAHWQGEYNPDYEGDAHKVAAERGTVHIPGKTWHDRDTDIHGERRGSTLHPDGTGYISIKPTTVVTHGHFNENLDPVSEEDAKRFIPEKPAPKSGVPYRNLSWPGIHKVIIGDQHYVVDHTGMPYVKKGDAEAIKKILSNQPMPATEQEKPRAPESVPEVAATPPVEEPKKTVVPPKNVEKPTGVSDRPEIKYQEEPETNKPLSDKEITKLVSKVKNPEDKKMREYLLKNGLTADQAQHASQLNANLEKNGHTVTKATPDMLKYAEYLYRQKGYRFHAVRANGKLQALYISKSPEKSSELADKHIELHKGLADLWSIARQKYKEKTGKDVDAKDAEDVKKAWQTDKQVYDASNQVIRELRDLGKHFAGKGNEDHTGGYPSVNQELEATGKRRFQKVK